MPGWKFYSFNPEHDSYREPSTLHIKANGSSSSLRLRRKMDTGTSYLVMFNAETQSWNFHTGDTFNYDTMGMLVWEGIECPGGHHERKQAALQYLQNMGGTA